MSYGLPTLALKKARNNEFKDNKDIIYFKNNYELIKKYLKLKIIKNFLSQYLKFVIPKLIKIILGIKDYLNIKIYCKCLII